MVNIIMRGCNGKMGQVISGLAGKDDEACIVAGVDISAGSNDIKNTYGYPVYKCFREVKECADVIIDFSSPADLEEMLSFAAEKNIPIVLCTTGYNREELDMISRAADKVAILKSANMSLGINTMLKVLHAVTKTLSDAGFDVEIVEKHHNQKADAPSGTALSLADAVNEELNNEYSYKYDRSAEKAKRPKKEIGISAVRGGSIVGEHEIIFAGVDEVIEFKHMAYSKAIFGNGALQAAKFLKGKPAGMYDMKDVLK